MRGHVAKKGVRYYPVVDLGQQPAQRCVECRKRYWQDEGQHLRCPKCNGDLVRGNERRLAWHPGHATKREAERALTELVASVNARAYVPRTHESVEEFLGAWTDELFKRCRPSTIASYRRALRTHVLPHIGQLELQDLEATHLDRLYTHLLRAGRRDGKGGLSPRTVRYVHTIIARALKDAVRQGKLVRNVSVSAEPPSAKAASAPEMSIWRPDQLHRFLIHVERDRLFPLYRVAAMTGMRRGEVCGLRWDDVNLEESRLTVQQQLVADDHELAIRTVKSRRSRRAIDLDPETVAVLRAWKKRQLEERVFIGDAWEDTGLVFTRADGSWLDPEDIAQQFTRRAVAAGLPVIRFHDLRHSHASHLIAANAHAKVISDRLGHSSVAFTLDRYGHMLPNLGPEAAVEVAKLVDQEGR